jgi:hypothetical protein
MARTDYIASIEKYVQPSTVDLLTSLTDEQFNRIVEATEMMGGSEPGIDNAMVKTHETLEDFDNSRRQHWAECRKATAGADYRHFEGVQMARGKARISDLVVVDLGDFRVALS